MLLANPPIQPILSSLGVAVGTPFTGRIAFESTTPDTDNGAYLGLPRGFYPGAILRFEFTVGSLHFDLPSAQEGAITIGPYETPMHSWAAVAHVPDSPIFDAPILRLHLEPAAPGVFNGDILPTVPPDLSALAPYASYFHVSGIDAFMRGSITGLEVPEPGIFALLAPLLLAARARRNRSHA